MCDYIVKYFKTKRGVNQRVVYYKAYCSECGADRGYKVKNALNQLCRSCAHRGKNNPMYGKESTFVEYNRDCRGKTLEERLGEERAAECRKKLSEQAVGKNNPMHGKESFFAKYNLRNTGKTLEERLGEIKAKQCRDKLSESSSGVNNPMYGKPSPSGSGNGWKGHYNGVYFRSVLELRYLRFFDVNKIEFISAESKDFSVPYAFNGVKRTYFPDYYLPQYDYVVEVKPNKLHHTQINRAKFQAACAKFNNFTVADEYSVPELPTAVLLSASVKWNAGYKKKVIDFIRKNSE